MHGVDHSPYTQTTLRISLWDNNVRTGTPRYNWHIIESGVKQHNPNPLLGLVVGGPLQGKIFPYMMSCL
jgi:hypothetical protein